MNADCKNFDNIKSLIDRFNNKEINSIVFEKILYTIYDNSLRHCNKELFDKLILALSKIYNNEEETDEEEIEEIEEIEDLIHDQTPELEEIDKLSYKEQMEKLKKENYYPKNKLLDDLNDFTYTPSTNKYYDGLEDFISEPVSENADVKLTISGVKNLIYQHALGKITSQDFLDYSNDVDPYDIDVKTQENLINEINIAKNNIFMKKNIIYDEKIKKINNVNDYSGDKILDMSKSNKPTIPKEKINNNVNDHSGDKILDMSKSNKPTIPKEKINDKDDEIKVKIPEVKTENKITILEPQKRSMALKILIYISLSLLAIGLLLFFAVTFLLWGWYVTSIVTLIWSVRTERYLISKGHSRSYKRIFLNSIQGPYFVYKFYKAFGHF